MWAAHQEALAGGRGVRIALEHEFRPATFEEVIVGWRFDPVFRSLFNALLASCSFSAFRWETPGVDSASQSQPFECVLLDSPGLARRPDPFAFAKQFTDPATPVAIFPNIGGDALLIVPCPGRDRSAYGHIASFVRFAPQEQRDALWQAVGDAMAERMSDRPVWLSTAGAGVPWLHVRLDDHPKYYGYSLYR